MSRFLIALLCACVLSIGVGCQNHESSDDTMKHSADACAKCPGVQKANADGTCPDCGMKMGSGGMTKTNESMGDACAKCPGVQKANADGSCAACPMKTGSDGMMKSNESTGDACSHCPGVQTAKADGSCPMCPPKAQ